MERSRCGPDVEEASLAPLFDQSAIGGVEPLYTIAADADFGQQEEVTGAVVRVRSLKGFTPEWLDRALECHGARRVLGKTPEVPNDPFWLPDGMVDIDVQSDHDGFRVIARGHNARDAQDILARAKAFAGVAR